MPSISLPSPGQKPWNLNPAITALNDEMETGRLSVDALNATFVTAVTTDDPYNGQSTTLYLNGVEL